MSDQDTIVGMVAEWLKIKPAQLKLKDVQEQIPKLRRKVSEYEREALAAEKEAMSLREKAFLPETNAAERPGLMRQAAQAAQKAQMIGRQAGIFLTHLSNFSSLETTMQIVDQLKEVGLLKKGVKIEDWQAVMDSMQVEIEGMIRASQRIGDVMETLMHVEGAQADLTTEKEIKALFKRWEEAKDPAEKARIQKEIDEKTGMPSSLTI
ncbi:MAG: hypothetical protein ONB24_14825 [candidate division KSB1 bacterium]|nr:hypothetical protein [candidate division KSB1 bacterium]